MEYIPEDIFNPILHEIDSNYTRHDFMRVCKYTYAATQKWRNHNWSLYGVALQPYHLEISRKKEMYIPQNHRLFALLHAHQKNMLTFIVTYKAEIKKWVSYLERFNGDFYNSDVTKSRIICETSHKSYFDKLMTDGFTVKLLKRKSNNENPTKKELAKRELIMSNKIIIMSLTSYKKIYEITENATVIVDDISSPITHYDMRLYTNDSSLPKDCVRVGKHSDNIEPIINIVKSNKLVDVSAPSLYKEFLASFNISHDDTLCIYSAFKLKKCNILPKEFNHKEHLKYIADNPDKPVFEKNKQIYLINDNYILERTYIPFDNIIIVNSSTSHLKLLNKGSNRKRVLNVLYVDTNYDFMFKKRCEGLGIYINSNCKTIAVYLNLLDINIYDLSVHDVKALFYNSYFDKYKTLAKWQQGTNNKLTEKQMSIILELNYNSSKFASKLAAAQKKLLEEGLKKGRNYNAIMSDEDHYDVLEY